MNNRDNKQKISDCWNHTGVWGTVTPRCPTLKEVTHCQNCSVYSGAGRQLLDRQTPDGYEAEWQKVYQAEKQDGRQPGVPVLTFRIGSEWMGLPVHALNEIANIPFIHVIPHRKNNVLQGLANVRGTLKLCISLAALMNFTGSEKQATGKQEAANARMIIARHGGEDYVFQVDEIGRIHPFSIDDACDPPATVSNAANAFVTRVFPLEDSHIGVLDVDLLFYAIQRNLA